MLIRHSFNSRMGWSMETEFISEKKREKELPHGPDFGFDEVRFVGILNFGRAFSRCGRKHPKSIFFK